MKNFFLWTLLFFILVSCKQEKNDGKRLQEKEKVVQNIVVSKFGKILEDAQLKGAILIYDFKNEKYYSNDFSWAKTGKLPASTYKIPNSIIALETNVVKDKEEIFKWNGERRALKQWEQDLTFQEAFRRSCVPCYQEAARRIGVARMNLYLEKLAYGNIEVNAENLDIFWLQGTSRIHQFQQIDFLKRLYQSELPISTRTEKTVKEMMLIKKAENFILRGKTGWSIANGINNGWFVGYVEIKENVFFFASNVEPKGEFDANKFQKNRKLITYEALKYFDILL